MNIQQYFLRVERYIHVVTTTADSVASEELDEYGALSLSPSSQTNPPTHPPHTKVPSFERVAALADVNVKFLCSSNGCEHLIAVSHSGKAYACGYNGRGQLGLGHTHHEVIPVPLCGKLLSKQVVLVACTYYHSALYVASREVYTFGRNSHGQLGVSDTIDRLEPERVSALDSRAISAIACGHYHTCFALTAGGVLSCGKNDYGQIGRDLSDDMKLTPTPVVSSLGHSELVIAISAGYYHTLALTSKGELYTYVLLDSLSLLNFTRLTQHIYTHNV